MDLYEINLQVFPSNMSFSLPLSLLVCLVSSPHAPFVFIGCAANDAATPQSGWCDFYRRMGNMGHKTRHHFPQTEEEEEGGKKKDLCWKSVSNVCGTAKMRTHGHTQSCDFRLGRETSKHRLVVSDVTS